MKVTIDVDEAVFQKVTAILAAENRTVETVLQESINEIAQDVVAIRLPLSAILRTLLMHAFNQRDLVAATLKTHWTSFESPMPQYLFSCARKWPGVIIDVGSNTGYYGLLGAAANIGNQVIAFEPDPIIYAALLKNIELNVFQSRITVFETALSNKVGSASLFVPAQDHGLVETSSSLETSFKSSHSEVRNVKVDTLDRFIAERPALAQSSVSLIKIDVEGHEASVLAGAHATVARWRPILFVEVLDRADFASLSSFIAQHDYLDVPLRDEGPLEAQGMVRYSPTVWNHAFVPPERLGEFLRFSRMV